MKSKALRYLSLSIGLHSSLLLLSMDQSAMYYYNDKKEGKHLLQDSFFDPLTNEQKEKLLDKFVKKSEEARKLHKLKPNY